MTTDYKEIIIKELDVLRKYETQQKNVFKARAYAKVIANLKAYVGEVHSIEDIKTIEGVGEKIKAKIQEIIITGHLQKAVDLRDDSGMIAREELLKVYGIGPAKADELVKAGIKSIADLRAAVEANPDILHDKQKIGLKHVEDINERIPRAEMDKHAARIEKMVKDADSRFIMEVVGSYRRGLKDSGDIDVLLTMPEEVSIEDGTASFEKLIIELSKKRRGTGQYMIEMLAQGDKKCMGVCRLSSRSKARRLDLLFLPANEYAYGVLYFTGSGAFNIGMRKWALGKGYTLNEHRLKPLKSDIAEPPVLKTEEEIFDFLGIRYIEPKEREKAADVEGV